MYVRMMVVSFLYKSYKRRGIMKIKLLAIFCVLVLLCTPISTSALGEDTQTIHISDLVKTGDLNVDGAIDSDDLVVIRKVLLGIDVDTDKEVCKVNADDAVNVKDLVALKKLISAAVSQ